MSSQVDRAWWQDGVVYQIWPASFKDGNGDGLGDLKGVIDSLDYIKSVGANIIWISPIFESPQEDMGYDISNYEDIHRPFGTVKDAEDLIAECHKRGMRLLFDLVINHTSDQHPWFQESRSSKDNPKRNWYHWRPARYIDGKRMPPNNWKSHFSGSTWAWDEQTQEYYLHLFAKGQPDLNWDCKELRQAVYKSAIKFWLDKGIDGFRIDAISVFGKDPSFPDAPITAPDSPWQLGQCHYRNKQRGYHYIAEMNRETFSKYDTMTVGEYGPMYDTNLALEYCGKAKQRINMGLQFETVYLGYGIPDKFKMVPFTLQQFRQTHAKWQKFIEGTDGWTTMYLENHDIGRSVSRFGCDDVDHDHTAASAKLLAMLQATATGTLFIYQGQEIGMTNIPPDWPITDYKDVETVSYWKGLQQRDSDEKAVSDFKRAVAKIGRDNARTPMQWSDAAYAGFSTSKPWMRVHDNFRKVNVAQQLKDDSTVLSFWKMLLRKRQTYIDLFAHGSYTDVTPDDPNVMMYKKEFGDASALIVLNFTCENQEFSRPDGWGSARLEVANFDTPTCSDSTLRPWEGRIYM